MVEMEAGLQSKLGCPWGNSIAQGLGGDEGVSWGYLGKRVLGRGTGRSIARALLDI